MITASERDAIIECARRYGASSVILFGSSLDETIEPGDIDLAVSGLPRGKFFEFYAELLKRLSKPVDLVDLSQPSAIAEVILREGQSVYG